MKIKIKTFLLNDKYIEKSSYIWNMMGSLFMAFQSVIMLMILTRTVGLVEAGIFTIANANANLFLTVGKYGMRYFQVSDVKNQFSFAEYRMSRIITIISMITVSLVFTLYSSWNYSYSFEKTIIIIGMCLFKVVDAVEDLYIALYQKNNRLDVAARGMTLRMFFTILIFGGSLIISKNLMFTLMISTVSTIVLLWGFVYLTYDVFKVDSKCFSWSNVSDLLKTCFPLCAGAFLSFYIGNAPKYAIDAVLNDELQACYGFISMPVFVIGLLNNFIFNPMIYRMSVLWSRRDIKAFMKKIVKQMEILAGITVCCLVGAYLLGIPVLSWLYNTELESYKTELLIILLGGGFLGLSGLLNSVITIIRSQNKLVWGYLIVSMLAYITSTPIVAKYGMMGAAIIYVVLMFILCCIFAGIFINGIRKKKHYNDCVE